jgi:hypothetical protein
MELIINFPSKSIMIASKVLLNKLWTTYSRSLEAGSAAITTPPGIRLKMMLAFWKILVVLSIPRCYEHARDQGTLGSVAGCRHSRTPGRTHSSLMGKE